MMVGCLGLIGSYFDPNHVLCPEVDTLLTALIRLGIAEARRLETAIDIR